MEIAEQNTIPFVGMNITKSGNKLETSVYRKSTNTGLLLHYHSHVDKRYKDCLLTTMIHRAYQLSSTPTAFSAECNKLRSTILNLDYQINLINSAINKFLRNIDNIDAAKNTRDDSSTIIVPLPFKDQPSANSVKKQMQVLNANIGVNPSFRPRRLAKFSLQRRRSPLLSTINAWFTKKCDLCDADYVRYTARHLHQRINEHKYSAIGKHLEQHGLLKNDLADKQFSVLRKCRSKFDCLIFEMLFIKELNPELNTQKDSIRAKFFT